MTEEDKLIQKILNIAYDAINASSRTWFSFKKALILMKAMGRIIDLCLERRKEENNAE